MQTTKMVLGSLKIRRIFMAVLLVALFLLFLNVIGPLIFMWKNESDQLRINEWFTIEQREKFKLNAQKEWTCPATKSAKTDVQMLNLYSQLPFDNLDGGVWAQGFDIKYDVKKVKEQKRLEVIVMPHTHCDPGWGWTFEEYYSMRTQHILNGMLKHLPNKTDMKFTYAEMSFFELWWSKLKDEEKELTKSFLNSGQLEILTGAWVMTDEANARSFSIVMEFIEGHEFLMNQLNYRPKSHWSIDPFGLSPTLAQLVKASNLTQMTIQRVHYSVKKHLAQTRQLEFRWRQMYAKGEETDVRTHMMPFQGYTAALTCGPDPKVCCQFDFQKLYSNCAEWDGPPPEPINSTNVKQRAQLLADQYRKKAQLYKMNTILVPLGDDFRYMTDDEWENQYENYVKLFESMNRDESLNINARFGTLNDYFQLLDQRLQEDQKDLPILSGDFFTYADRDDHYWSGYYTSRPFYKHMDRTVQHYVRTADILYSLALWKTRQEGSTAWLTSDSLYNALVESRRSLSLFQHHDGITGTSRDYVVLDYGQKMLNAINNCTTIITEATNYLLDIPTTTNKKEQQQLKHDLEYYLEDLPEQIKVETGSTLLIHNSLAFNRHEVVCLTVPNEKTCVQQNSKNVKQQIQPKITVLKSQFLVRENEYQLCFEAKIKALGYEKFELVECEKNEEFKAKVEVSKNFDSTLIPGGTYLSQKADVSLSNDQLLAKIDSKTGYLKSIQYRAEKELNVEMEFLHYGARLRSNDRITGANSMSGPYLFLPNGHAKSLSTSNNSFILIKGDVRQTLLLRGPDDAQVFQQLHLDFNANALDIVNRVDVQKEHNFELTMRLKSKHFRGQDEQFYTDLNGFQMIRRKRFEKLPIQAHFYPMTTAAFIDARGRRLTLLARQSLGAASLKPGWIESILDRTLAQDDDRGIGQGVSDNKHTESHFRLLIEPLASASQSNSEDNRAGFLSFAALQLSHTLNYPLLTLYGQLKDSNKMLQSQSFLSKPFPCDIHLFALRTLSEPTQYTSNGDRQTQPKHGASIILERQGIECSAKGEAIGGCAEIKEGKISLYDHFSFRVKSTKLTSLTGMYEQSESSSSLTNAIQLQPMDLKAVKIEF